MIIKKVVLHNFGVYAMDNIFEFNNDKPVILIGGMNGRGKTTFLEAILLALYGANSFAIKESKYKYYGTYLRAHVNTSDGTNTAFVELEFDLQEENVTNTYNVVRLWNSNNKYIKDKVNVKKNGNTDDFLTKNWAMFVESVLPSALANFYFFDGEKIAELAEGETSKQMKDSIKSLLGINIIDLLNNDLNRVMKKLNNEQTEDYDAVKLEEYRIIKEQKEVALNDIDAKIEELNKEFIETCKQLDIKIEEFNAKGGHIADKSKELYSERSSLNGQLEQIKAGFIDLATTELPLMMVKNRLERIINQVSNERESKTMEIAVEKISKIFVKYSALVGNIGEVCSFIDFIKDQTSSSQVKYMYNFSDNAFAQLTLLYSNQSKSANNYVNYKTLEEKIVNRLNEVDNYLSVDIDEKAIQKIYKKICELENRKIELETQLNAAKKDRTAINGEFLSANTDFNRCVEKSLATMERDDDIKRIRRYILLAQKTSSEYKLQLQKAKIKKLADIMTDCYKKLSIKKDFINNIVIDCNTLDYHYIDRDNKIIMKNSLSAGEKQLMVIAMLWALAECSKQMLPVIIDTPLARLDSYHRTTLIDKYFPNASRQTIILSTDSEIDSTYYQVIRKHVSTEFTLVYDEESKSSHIEEGYFKGVIG